MIEKIKKYLIVKYTLIICLMLAGVAFSCYFLHRHMLQKMMNEALSDYLHEEVWEAEQHLKDGSYGAGFYKINSDVGSIHNFSYWYLGNRLIHAEEPISDEISAELQRRMQNKTYQENKIYNENVKHQKVKWYFRLSMQDVRLSGKTVGRVFVLSNVTPMVKSNKRYAAYAVYTILILSALAYLVGSVLAGRAIEQINKFFEKQKRFVADASHELRTPLSVLLAYTELLERGRFDAAVISDMKEEIIGMSQLSAHLLELARSDNDQLQLKRERFDLAALVRTAVEHQKPFAQEKKIKITFDGPSALDFAGDKNLLKQLMYILLDNAIKYTPENGLAEVSVRQCGEAAELVVKDSGIGIPETDREHIFERFYRAEKSRNRNRGGLGLGLSLAEIIVQSHRGTIRVESEEGKGSVFTVILPEV